MSEKILVPVVSLMNFGLKFEKRFGVKFKIRNYHLPNVDPKEAYFEFEDTPTTEMMNSIGDFAQSLGGKAEFSEDKKRFIIIK